MNEKQQEHDEQEQRREQARSLLVLARRDLGAVEVLSMNEDVDDSIVGFHVQQAAEKALKAWLQLLGEHYPKSHDLSLLLGMLEDQRVDVEPFEDLVDFGSFAVQYRYELFDDEPLDREDSIVHVVSLIEHVERLEKLDT